MIEGTVDFKEELDDIDKRFDENRGANLKYKKQQHKRLTTDIVHDACDTIKDVMEVALWGLIGY